MNNIFVEIVEPNGISDNMSQELSNQLAVLTEIVKRVERTTNETAKRVEKVSELDMSINHRDVGLVEEVKKLKAETKEMKSVLDSMDKRLDKIEQKFAYMGAAAGAIMSAIFWLANKAWIYFTH